MYVSSSSLSSLHLYFIIFFFFFIITIAFIFITFIVIFFFSFSSSFSGLHGRYLSSSNSESITKLLPLRQLVNYLNSKIPSQGFFINCGLGVGGIHLLRAEFEKAIY
jgi:hypothetical protein